MGGFFEVLCEEPGVVGNELRRFFGGGKAKLGENEIAPGVGVSIGADDLENGGCGVVVGGDALGGLGVVGGDVIGEAFGVEGGGDAGGFGGDVDVSPGLDEEHVGGEEDEEGGRVGVRCGGGVFLGGGILART